jgi:transposase
MKGTESYTQDRLHRWHVLQMAIDGHITLLEASTRLGVSYRQAKRLKSAVVSSGLAGLQHGNCGRRSSRAISDHERTRILHLARTQYADVNDTRLTERLKSEHGISLSRETVRKILRAEGIHHSATGPRGRAASLPSCYTREGMMVLWGAVSRDWFGTGDSCFMAAVDTATLSCLAARFFTTQSSTAYLWLLRETVRRRGVPAAFCQYSRNAVRHHDAAWTIDEELRGERDPTQVERALRTLGISYFFESKRRVISIPALFQAFLEEQFENRDIPSLEKANQLLENGLIKAFNRRYACAPGHPEPAWRPLPEGMDLDRACSFYYLATVRHDNKIQLGDLEIGVPPGQNRISYARAQVEVRQLLDGSWLVYHHNQIIATHSPTPLREPVAARSIKARPEAASLAWAYVLLSQSDTSDD